MPTITTKDGTEIYYKDWGSGQPVVFSHGWPLSADAWDDQMLFLAERGYRCIAHDRRGHGRSGQPWNGNNMDTYADDLAELTAALELNYEGLSLTNAGGSYSTDINEFICSNADCSVAKDIRGTVQNGTVQGVVVTPEPSTAILLSLAIVGLLLASKRKQFVAW